MGGTRADAAKGAFADGQTICPEREILRLQQDGKLRAKPDFRFVMWIGGRRIWFGIAAPGRFIKWKRGQLCIVLCFSGIFP